MWIEGPSPLAPEISKLLPQLILDLALVEDVTGPWCSQVARDEYMAGLALRLREPVVRSLREAGIAVSEEELAKICGIAASETFVIRRLNEAQIEGEVLVADFRHLPFYLTYQGYFEQSPEIVARALQIALQSAAQDRVTRPDTHRN
jgi:hypothetical protein